MYKTYSELKEFSPGMLEDLQKTVWSKIQNLDLRITRNKNNKDAPLNELIFLHHPNDKDDLQLIPREYQIDTTLKVGDYIYHKSEYSCLGYKIIRLTPKFVVLHHGGKDWRLTKKTPYANMPYHTFLQTGRFTYHYYITEEDIINAMKKKDEEIDELQWERQRLLNYHEDICLIKSGV